MKFILLLISFVCGILGSRAQTEDFRFSIQIMYKLDYQPDSTDSSHREEAWMQLLCNEDGQSLFRSLQSARDDSLMYDQLQKGKPINYPIRPLFGIERLRFQIKKEKGTITTYDALSGVADEQNAMYYFDESLRQFDWQISKDTLTMMGYLCQRADVVFGGREWTAWYCPDIPIFDGPYKFAGLPGLILKLHDKKGHWCFETQSILQIEKKVSINFLPAIRYRQSSKEMFFSDRMHYQKNILQLREAAGQLNRMTDGMKAEIRRNYASMLKKDNNWIELYP